MIKAVSVITSYISIIRLYHVGEVRSEIVFREVALAKRFEQGRKLG